MCRNHGFELADFSRDILVDFSLELGCVGVCEARWQRGSSRLKGRSGGASFECLDFSPKCTIGRLQPLDGKLLICQLFHRLSEGKMVLSP